jgi:Protein of unknown function (DUF3987)
VNLLDDPHITTYHQRLSSLIDRPVSHDFLNGCKTRSISLDRSSKNLWIDFHDSNEVTLPNENKEISGFSSKAPGLVLRIAGVMTILDDPTAEVISKKYLENAIQLMKWYQEEFFRIFCNSSSSPELDLAQKVLEWAIQKHGLHTPFSHSELINKGPSKARDTNVAKRIMQLLVEQEYAESHQNIEIGESW